MRARGRRGTGGAGRRGKRLACGRPEAGVAGIVMRAPLESSDSIQGSRRTAPLHVVILAAGEGKRMKSRLPKVLQKIAGQPFPAPEIAAARGMARGSWRERGWTAVWNAGAPRYVKKKGVKASVEY